MERAIKERYLLYGGSMQQRELIWLESQGKGFSEDKIELGI